MGWTWKLCWYSEISNVIVSEMFEIVFQWIVIKDIRDKKGKTFKNKNVFLITYSAYAW